MSFDAMGNLLWGLVPTSFMMGLDKAVKVGGVCLSGTSSNFVDLPLRVFFVSLSLRVCSGACSTVFRRFAYPISQMESLG